MTLFFSLNSNTVREVILLLFFSKQRAYTIFWFRITYSANTHSFSRSRAHLHIRTLSLDKVTPHWTIHFTEINLIFKLFYITIFIVECRAVLCCAVLSVRVPAWHEWMKRNRNKINEIAQVVFIYLFVVLLSHFESATLRHVCDGFILIGFVRQTRFVVDNKYVRKYHWYGQLNEKNIISTFCSIAYKCWSVSI